MVIKSVGYLSLILGIVFPTTVSLATISPPAKYLVTSARKMSLNFPDAPDGEPPTSTAGGGTRGTNCKISDDIPMTALVPSKNTLTVSANPTFFIYIPKITLIQSDDITIPKTTVVTGEFILVDNKGNDVYNTMIKLPLEGNIVQITLPQTVALEVGSKYKWQFSVKCPSSNSSYDDFLSLPELAFLEVNIQRSELTPTLKGELEQTQDLLKKAEIYARENIWQDTLMIMAQLRNSQQEEWKNLLNSIKLQDAIINAPFAPETTEINPNPNSPQ